MERLLKDVRYACALMGRSPGFTTAGLLSLGLGIGATTAVFSVVYRVPRAVRRRSVDRRPRRGR